MIDIIKIGDKFWWFVMSFVYGGMICLLFGEMLEVLYII